ILMGLNKLNRNSSGWYWNNKHNTRQEKHAITVNGIRRPVRESDE
ncbi:2530_t:CDS:1, partial [Paraglomus occultum]